jgi:hypothetical protein
MLSIVALFLRLLHPQLPQIHQFTHCIAPVHPPPFLHLIPIPSPSHPDSNFTPPPVPPFPISHFPSVPGCSTPMRSHAPMPPCPHAWSRVPVPLLLILHPQSPIPHPRSPISVPWSTVRPPWPIPLHLSPPSALSTTPPFPPHPLAYPAPLSTFTLPLLSPTPPFFPPSRVLRFCPSI